MNIFNPLNSQVRTPVTTSSPSQPMPAPKLPASTISSLIHGTTSIPVYNPKKRFLGTMYTGSTGGVSALAQQAISPSKRARYLDNAGTTTTTTSIGNSIDGELNSETTTTTTSSGFSIDGEDVDIMQQQQESAESQESPGKHSILGALPVEVVIDEILSKLDLEDILNFEAVAQSAQNYTQTFWRAYLVAVRLLHNSSLFSLTSGRESYLFGNCLPDLAVRLAGIQKIEDMERINILKKYTWLEKRIPLLHDFLNYVTFQKTHSSSNNIYFSKVEKLLQQIDRDTMIPQEGISIQSPLAASHNISKILSSIANDNSKRVVNLFIRLICFDQRFDKVVLRIFSKEVVHTQDKVILMRIAGRRFKFHDYRLGVDAVALVPNIKINVPEGHLFYPLRLLSEGIQQCKVTNYELADKKFDDALAKIPTIEFLGLLALEHVLKAKVQVNKLDEATKFVHMINRLWNIPKIIPKENIFRASALLQYYFYSCNIEMADELVDRLPQMDFLENETLVYLAGLIKCQIQKYEAAEKLFGPLISAIEKQNPEYERLPFYRFKLAEAKFGLKKYVEAEELLDKIYAGITRSTEPAPLFYPQLLVDLANVKKALYKYDETDSFIKMAQGFYLKKYKVALSYPEMTWDECLAADRAGADEIPDELPALVVERFGN